VKGERESTQCPPKCQRTLPRFFGRKDSGSRRQGGGGGEPR
jgi:hypothetical protein